MAFSALKIHEQVVALQDESISVQIIEMKESYYVYVSLVADTAFKQLAMAVPTKYDQLSIGTTLINPTLDNYSERMAQRLSTRFKKQVTVSYNLPNNTDHMFMLLQVKMIELIAQLDIQDCQVAERVDR